MEFTTGRAFAVLMVAVACARLCEAVEDTRELEHICTNTHASTVDMINAWSAATDAVVQKTPSNGFHYKTKSTVGGATMWAIGACNGRLQQNECSRCMTSAKVKLSGVCTSLVFPSIGARIKLVDCRLRWETYDFDW